MRAIFPLLPACPLLQPGDLLVFNDTQVVKARLFGEKPTGGKLELLVERVLQGREVVAHMKVSKKPPLGTELRMDGGFTATLLGRWPEEDGPLFRFGFSDDPHALMERHGHVPLPPYIEHGDSADDVRRYQTVFAREPGAVAAPTAALHFDEALLARLAARGVGTAHVTLHVGAGTFQPVRVESLAEHKMHSEWFQVTPETVDAIARCRAADSSARETDIFITPGFDFQVVDRLVTNFHLPKSTLMMLVSAFAGYEPIMALYRHAIAQRYRFFSYGDAMLLERARERSGG